MTIELTAAQLSANPRAIPASIVIDSLAPGTQQHAVLLHMLRKDHITQVEAHELYRVYRLASRINDLKNRGVAILASQVTDLTGRRYVRYSLA